MLAPHSALPEIFAWPLVSFTALVTALRWRWCTATFGERHVNAALTGATVAWLLLIGTAQHRVALLVPWLPPARQYQIANAIMILVTAEAYLMISRARKLNRPSVPAVYLAAVAMGVGYVLIGIPVADGGGIDLQYPGWETAIMTVLFVIFPYACAVLIVIACVQEIAARPALGAWLFSAVFLTIFTGLLISLSFGLAASIVLATGRIDGFTEYAARTDRSAFVTDIIGITPLAAVALVLRLVDAWRGDPVTRAISRLTPLWEDLTEACPDVVQPRPDTAGATYRLHRMVIEIHDAILALTAYVPAGPAADRSIAPRLAAAWAAKVAGHSPNPAASLDLPGGADLQTETRILTSLAKEWSACRPSRIRPGVSP